MPVSTQLVQQYYTGILRLPASDAVVNQLALSADVASLTATLLNMATNTVDPVVRLYQAAFNRVPDNQGLTNQVGVYQGNINNSGSLRLDQMASSFTGSQEFIANYGLPTTNNAANTVFIASLYTNVLGRTTSGGEEQGWINFLNNGGSRDVVLNGFAQSPEFIRTTSAAVDNFLTGAGAGTATYTGTLNSYGPATIYTLTTSSPETITATGDVNVINGTQATFQASDIIIGKSDGMNTLRIVDTGTAAYSLPAASVTGVQNIVLQNINGRVAVPAVTPVNEQQTVSVTGTIGNATSTVSFLGVATASVASGAEASTVAAAITTAKAAIIEGAQGVALGLIDIANTGAVLTLTFSSAKGNVANVFSPQSGTGGVISFGAGVETVVGVAGVPGISAAQFTDTVTATNFIGATRFVSERSLNQVDFLALTSAQSVTKDGGSGAVEATWGATGVTPVLNIANGSTAGAVTVVAPNATSLTINSTGAANTIGALGAPASATALNINATTNLTTGAITATAVTGINVSGAATLVTLGTLPAAVTTINGSGLTAGGITVELTNTVTSFIGGAGVDTVTTVATTTAASTINGGSGAGDILNVNDTTSISTNALGGRFTNFEVLRNTAGGATLNVSTVSGITAIQLGATGQGAVGMTAAQAMAVTNRVDNATQTLALATATGTTDVLTVTLQNTTATGSADLTSTTVTGFETMNVVSSSGGTGADINQLTFAAAGQLRAVNLSGAFPLAMTTANLTAAAGVAINASAMTFAGSTTTAAFTISGNLLKGSVVTGTETRDAITTSARAAGAAGEFVTYNAGGGNDAIASTVEAINNTNASFASLRINGGAGTDTLTLSEAAAITITDATFQHLSNIETIVLATGDNAISITTGGFFDANFRGNATTTLTLGGTDNTAINTLNAATFQGNLTVSLTSGATTAVQTVTTGSGNDTITITAASYTGATNGILVNAGAGNDIIRIGNTVTTNVANAINITGGLGADTISVGTAGAAQALSYVTFVTGVNESTVTAFDNITGYFNGTTRRSDTIDFTGSAVVASNATAVAIAGFTSGELTYSITTGVMSFAGTSAATLTVAQKAAIAVAAITTDLQSVVFTQAAENNTVDSYVFNNNALGDSLVQLIGVTATSLVSTGTAGAGVVAIA